MKTKMKKVKIDKVELLIDEDEIIYCGKCVECGKLLTLEERSYGHDCE